MLPDSVTAGEHDGQDRAIEGQGERERPGFEVGLDSEDAALGEHDQALTAC
jgi:hypothetical protein